MNKLRTFEVTVIKSVEVTAISAKDALLEATDKLDERNISDDAKISVTIEEA